MPAPTSWFSAATRWLFTGYDGVLQMGVPPVRIDILNRADGITFDEAVAEGAKFELNGRAIPVIGWAVTSCCAARLGDPPCSRTSAPLDASKTCA